MMFSQYDRRFHIFSQVECWTKKAYNPKISRFHESRPIRSSLDNLRWKNEAMIDLHNLELRLGAIMEELDSILGEWEEQTSEVHENHIPVDSPGVYRLLNLSGRYQVIIMNLFISMSGIILFTYTIYLLQLPQYNKIMFQFQVPAKKSNQFFSSYYQAMFIRRVLTITFVYVHLVRLKRYLL